jgi:hypothetical protein
LERRRENILPACRAERLSASEDRADDVDAYVHWRDLSEGDESRDQLRCLYAYVGPRGREILYIGKAWGRTVRQRWERDAKSDFWNDLERERGIFRHGVMVGTIALYPSDRLSHRLLADIESLLIMGLQPWGNIQSRNSRISRPGFRVACRGSRPFQNRRFLDAG